MSTPERTHPSYAIKIPVPPGRGEIWFSINLQLIEDVPGLYALLRQLGFQTPQLAWLQYPTGDVEVHLLLHHEVRPQLEEPDHELFGEEQYQPADAINPDAIRCSGGLTGRLSSWV